jgi:hypothetical protein
MLTLLKGVSGPVNGRLALHAVAAGVAPCHAVCCFAQPPAPENRPTNASGLVLPFFCRGQANQPYMIESTERGKVFGTTWTAEERLLYTHPQTRGFESLLSALIPTPIPLSYSTQLTDPSLVILFFKQHLNGSYAFAGRKVVCCSLY